VKRNGRALTALDCFFWKVFGYSTPGTFPFLAILLKMFVISDYGEKRIKSGGNIRSELLRDVRSPTIRGD
jgi:hypothetical protein